MAFLLQHKNDCVVQQNKVPPPSYACRMTVGHVNLIWFRFCPVLPVTAGQIVSSDSWAPGGGKHS